MENQHPLIGKKILVNTNEWFTASDGLTYRALHGTLKNVHKADTLLGFPIARGQANWVYEIGSFFISGCQINYIQQTEDANTGIVNEWYRDQGFVDKPAGVFKTE